MIIDIHIHEKTFSSDSEIELQEIVEEARRKGLDGICITDHDSNGIAEKAMAYRRKSGFTVLVGAEILSYEGDILVFGIDKLPAVKLHAEELLKLVAEQGGIGIAAHPYRDNKRGLGDNILTLKNLAGFEVLNGRTEAHNNLHALKVYQQTNIPGLGGSDAHKLNEVGCCATYFSHKIKDESDFVQAVKAKGFEPVFYENGLYKKVKKGVWDEKISSFNCCLGFGI